MGKYLLFVVGESIPADAKIIHVAFFAGRGYNGGNC
jgi:hypothetical protein